MSLSFQAEWNVREGESKVSLLYANDHLSREDWIRISYFGKTQK